MNTPLGLERCLTFINCQLQPAPKSSGADAATSAWRAITISRQTGCGAHAVAEIVAGHLQSRTRNGAPPWTVFDKDLVERVLEDHHLPKRLARFMPEDRISESTDTLDELFGLHPPSWMLVRQTAETILHLAVLGHVILIGRGANVITGKLHGVFHVRLVAPLDTRLKRIQQLNQLGAKEALAMIRREDLGRKRYLKKYFRKDIDDPLLYHLIINTDLVSCEQAARLIGDAVSPHKTI